MAEREIKYVVTADGRAFSAGLEGALAEAGKFEKGVERLTAKIKALDGGAAQMRQLRAAVTDLGGIDKLAGPQLDNVKRRVEALAKAGAAIPPEFAKIERALKLEGGLARLKAAGAELQGVGAGLAGSLGPAGSAMAALGPAGLVAAAGVAALAASGGALLKVLSDSTASAVAYGSRIQEISANTGIAADSVQRLIAAGVNIDAVTGAVGKLQKSLIDSPEKFAQLGLSADALKKMKPEESLGRVVEKIQLLGTEAERTSARYELLGKNFPTSQLQEFQDLAAKGARGEQLGLVMDPGTIAQLKAVGEEASLLGKTWDGLWNNLGAGIATTPGVQDALRGLTDSVGALSAFILENKDNIQGFGAAIIGVVSPAVRDLTAHIRNVATSLQGLMAMADAARQKANSVSGRFALGDSLVAAGVNQFLPGVGTQLMFGPKPAPQLNNSIGNTPGKPPSWASPAAIAAAEKMAAATQKLQKSLDELELAAQRDLLAEQKRQEAEAVAQLNGQLQEELRLMLQLDALGNSTVAGNASPEDIAAARGRQRVIDMMEQLTGGPNFEQTAGLAFLEQNKGNLSPEVYEKIRAHIMGVKEETEKAGAATVSWADAAQGVLAIIDALGLSGTKLGGLLGAIGGGAAAFENLGDRLKRTGSAGGLGGLFKDKDGKGGLSGILGGATSLLGGASAAIGIGKAIVGLFKSDPVKKAQKQIGQQMGVAISRELAESIRANAKTLGVSLATAGLLSLGAVMAEGQAQGKSAASFSSQALSALQLTKDPKLAAKATGEVGTAFAEIAAEAEKAGVFGTAAVRSIIREARNLKAEIPEIKAFIDEQLTSAAAGVGAGIKGIRVTSPEDIQAQASIASVTFWAVFKEKGLLAAGDAFKEIVASLGKSLEELGGDEIAQQLLGPIQAIVDLSENELFRGAAEGAQGFANTLKGLANSDIPLTTSQFGAFGQQAQAAFRQAVEGGANSEQALLAIAPLLQAIVQGAASYGLEIDEGTQALIDQAKAAGIAFKTDGTERLIQSIDALTVALGGVPPALDKIGASADKLDGKTIDLTVRYNEPDMMPGQFNEGGFTEGGQGVTAAAGFGPKRLSRDTLFQAHAGEHVMIVPRGKPISFRSAARGFFQDPEMGGDPGGGGLPPPGSLGGGGSGSSGTGSSSGGTGGGGTTPPDQTGGVIEELQQQQAHTTTVLEDVKEILRTIARQPRGQVLMPTNVTVQENGFNTQRDRQEFERGVERSVARGIRAGTSPVLDALKDSGFVTA